MKLSKLFLGLGTISLTLGGASALVVASAHKTNEQPVVAEAETGYTTYYNTDLGFNTRNSSVNLVVIGDADGGMQTKGNVLDPKCELNLTYKNYNYDCWIGVGGYAVYISGGSQLRFLYLTHNDNSAYNRNVEKGGLVMKTYDGSTALLDVISGGKFFSDYLNVVYRWDLTNLSAVKASFHAVYNGVTYYPFDGATRIDSITYTHQAIDFSSEDSYRAMMGANASGSGIDLIKFKTEEKNLENIISPSAPTFLYEHIGDFFFSFALTEQIFSRTGYLNDHLNSYTDANSQVIDLANGIVINGRTFDYWRNFTDTDLTYTSNSGVHCFPLEMGGQYAPVAIEDSDSALSFKVNADYLPLDSIVVTFKAGLFAGYNAGTTYKLAQDLTFRTTLEDTDSTKINDVSKSVKLVRVTNETVHVDYRITDASDNGVQVNDGGYNYYKYTLWTNIPRNTNFNQGWSQDHYRYLYNNFMLNGKPFSNYNSWARGNSKDATAEYETKHPLGSANANYDLAIQLKLATDQTNYVFWVYFPYQLMTDLGMSGTPKFSIRDGSAWLTPDGVIRFNCTPEEKYAVEAFVEANMHLNDYTAEQGYCADNEHHYYLTAKTAFNALSAGEKSAFQYASCFADAKERFEAWARACGDANPYDGNNGISSSNVLSPIKNSSIAIIIAIASILTSVTVVGVLFLKKKRVN